MGVPVLMLAQSILAVLACQLVLMGAIDAYIVNGGPFGGRDLDLMYPSGKHCDPLGLANDPDMAADLKVKEIKKGCLAMLSMFGYYVQAAVTGPGPVENWASHVADPFAVNGLTLEIAAQYTLSVAMSGGRRTARWICHTGVVLTARGGWAPTLRTATFLTTCPVSTLVTTVGATVGLLQAPRPSGQHVGSIAIFNPVLCPCLLHLSLDCCSAAPLGVLLACCSAAALPCFAPYPRRSNGRASACRRC